MNRSFVAVLSSLVLISCASQIAPGDTVRYKDTAIGIGRKDCNTDIPQKSRDEGWHASLSGDYWKVWFGAQYYDDAFLTVLVSKHDGKTTGCVLAIH